ncbi:uroporphyrinogen-III synthase [Specibacter cremeus]|uniref:uroporphyrinogen-III synthase n=1 Tax=Specibacter cremeus TaxID=1629051 RepID=UPI000F7B6BC0|nr:uroporphyrinogen-III synthase [Specibacter cremeus]
MTDPVVEPPVVELVETKDPGISTGSITVPVVELVEAPVVELVEAPAGISTGSITVPVVELVETKDPGISTGSIAGLRVAVTRSADRAGALADALAAAGAEPVLVPVIDFETADQDALGSSLRRLQSGEYRWLVISSITTVRALKQWCDAHGASLAALVPAGTSVATIGPTSVAVLAAEGVRVDLAPVDVQSAAGLVALWPEKEGPGRVLLPQSNLAEPTLVDGITARGWTADVVTAYRTVDHPASADLRLTARLAAGGGGAAGDHPMLTTAEAAGDVRAGRINAVVLASGSAARRVAETLAPLPDGCRIVAIGQPTRREAERLGLAVAATAEHPTPAGIVAALVAAFHESQPSLEPNP